MFASPSYLLAQANQYLDELHFHVLLVNINIHVAEEQDFPVLIHICSSILHTLPLNPYLAQGLNQDSAYPMRTAVSH